MKEINQLQMERRINMSLYLLWCKVCI